MSTPPLPAVCLPWTALVLACKKPGGSAPLHPTSFHAGLGGATVPKMGQDGRWVETEELVHECSHRQEEQRPGGPLRCPGGSLGQGLKDGIHLLCHGCQRKLKLILCKASGRRVRRNLASESARGDMAGVEGAGNLEGRRLLGGGRRGRLLLVSSWWP